MCGGSCNTEEVTTEEIIQSVVKILKPKIANIKVEQFGVYPVLLNFQEVTALQMDLRALSNSKETTGDKQP